MEQKKYIYDAFISYRHTELDKFVAENLHKQMESFKPPKSILKNDNNVRTKINRVFRDKDELPLASNLEDPIVEALKNSEYLVVICSPRLKESIWCKKEIQTFIEMHGRRNILAVLIEGEPAESFPDELLYDGDKPIEPLAADFRGNSKKEIKKAMKSEILRLLAPMFNVSYDDLKQRHREKKIKRAILLTSVIAALGILFGAVSTYAALKINSQKNEIASQKDEIETQKDQIEEQAVQLAKEQAVLLSDQAMRLYNSDNRVEAVKLAYAALTQYQGVDMPQTAEAERTLAKCLKAYDGGGNICSGTHIETKGVIEDAKISPNGQYILTYDDRKTLVLWNMNEDKDIFTVGEDEFVDSYEFIDDNSFMYLSDANALYRVDINTLDKIMYDLNEKSVLAYMCNAMPTEDGSNIVIQWSDSLEVLDSKTLDIINEYEISSEKFMKRLYLSKDSKKAIVLSGFDDSITVTAFDLESGFLYEEELPINDISNVYCTEDTVFAIDLVTEDFISGKTVLVAFDLNNGAIKYEKEYDREMYTDIKYSNGTGGEHLLMQGMYQSMMVDASTGEKIDNYYTDSKVAMTMPTESGGFILYLSNGNCDIIDGAYPYNCLGISSLQCNDVNKFIHVPGCLYGIHNNDNRIVKFGRLVNSDATVYEGDLAENVSECEMAEDAMEYAKDNQLDDEVLVKNILKMQDANMLLVGYADNRFATYRLDSMEKLAEYDNCYVIETKYYGKIGDYYVVSGTRSAYIINDDGEMVAEVPDFAGVSESYDGVVVYGKDADANGVLYKLPVYTKKMLLEKAERFMEMVVRGN